MHFLKRHLSFIALIGSWVLLFLVLSMSTGWGLAPWESIFPLPDSLTPVELALNNFFDVGPGQYLFAFPVLLISIRVWWRLRQQRYHVVLSLALSNFILIFACSMGLSIVDTGNQFLFPEAYGVRRIEALGYHMAILPLLNFVLNISLWTWFQQRLLRAERKEKKKKNKDTTDARNNKSYEEALNLLAGSSQIQTELRKEPGLTHGQPCKWRQQRE